MKNYFIMWELKRCNDWHLSFCIFPRHCSISGKPIWLTKAYKGKYNGSIIHGAPVVITHYIDKFEFVKWQLKG